PDDGSVAVSLGTGSFRLYNTVYTSVNVCVDGFISLGSIVGPPTAYTPQSLATGPAAAMVAPLWEDWYTADDGFDDVMTRFFDVDADGVNDYLLVEWQAYHFATTVTAANQVTFQAVLQLN